MKEISKKIKTKNSGPFLKTRSGLNFFIQVHFKAASYESSREREREKFIFFIFLTTAKKSSTCCFVKMAAELLSCAINDPGLN